MGQYLTTRLDEQQYWWIYLDATEEVSNALNPECIQELIAACQAALQQSATLIVITSQKPQSFMDGYSLRYLLTVRHLQTARRLAEQTQELANLFQQATIPIVAIVNGLCRNAGLELTSACDYIISLPEAQYQHNEVELGFLPSAGGIHHLTKRMGKRQAIDWFLQGNTLNGQQAGSMGLSDFLTTETRYLPLLASCLKKGKRHTNTPTWHFNHLLPSPFTTLLLKKQVNKYHSQTHIKQLYKQFIQQWQTSYPNPKQCLAAEAEQFAQLLLTPISRSLIKLKAAEQQLLAKLPPTFTTIQSVHIVGNTPLALQLTWECVKHNMQVNLQTSMERNEVNKWLSEYANQEKSTINAAYIQKRFNCLAPNATIPSDIDIIIEATDETLRAKQELLAHLEENSPYAAPLLTHSLGLHFDTLISPLLQPERLIGLHFFLPFKHMKLVEILHKPNNTSIQAIERTIQFMRLINKLPMVISSNNYFVVPRILMIYLVQGMRLQQQGVPTTIIDQAAREFGMQLGPLELADQIGLDMCLHLGELAKQKIGLEIPVTLREMVNANKLGMKTRAGFYRYRNGHKLKPEREHWPGNFELMKTRLVKQMVEEAQICLELGLFEQPELVDLSVVHGVGFPSFHGGPIHYATNQ